MTTDYWCIEAGPRGDYFRVTPETAKTVITQLEEGIVEFVQFTDITGARCGSRAAAITSWWESTADGRERDRALSEAVRAEAPTVPGMGE